jgi:hypothetical protein
MLAAHLRAAHSNAMKFGVITGIRTVVQRGLRLEQQKLQTNHHESNYTTTESRNRGLETLTLDFGGNPTYR